MWMLTTRGFFSVVAHRHDDALVLIRARVRDDLLALRPLAPGLEPYSEGGSDYPWRAEMPRDEWARVAALLAAEIDYENFKSAIADRQGDDRAIVYSQVWSVLRELERS
jgi:hypothetical protein